VGLSNERELSYHDYRVAGNFSPELFHNSDVRLELFEILRFVYVLALS
jgi:hypothetical protein